MITPALKACPFCGESDVHQEYGIGNEKPYVRCSDCGATVDGMAGAWNSRAVMATADTITLDVQTAREIEAALAGVANARALAEVRTVVAGWNGENRPEGPHMSRHPSNLGATLPKTNCGAVYDLDEALQNARAALSKLREKLK